MHINKDLSIILRTVTTIGNIGTYFLQTIRNMIDVSTCSCVIKCFLVNIEIIISVLKCNNGIINNETINNDVNSVI